MTLAFVAVFLAAMYFFPARDIALDLIAQIRGYGPIAPFLYFCVFLAAAIAGFSRTILLVVAGIIFEPVVAFTVAVGSTTATFVCTFVLARYLVADWIAGRLKKIPAARSLMSAVEQHGFKMLVLMRLNPFIPDIVNGYGFGMTRMRPLPYFVASMLGSLPLTLIYVYLGWVGGEAILRGGAPPGEFQNGTLIFGAVISVVMLIAIGWYFSRASESAGPEVVDN